MKDEEIGIWRFKFFGPSQQFLLNLCSCTNVGISTLFYRSPAIPFLSAVLRSRLILRFFVGSHFLYC